MISGENHTRDLKHRMLLQYFDCNQRRIQISMNNEDSVHYKTENKPCSQSTVISLCKRFFELIK